MRKLWVLVLSVVAMVCAAGVVKVKAQVAPVFGQVRVMVPFEFYAGDTQFPAGTYVIKRLNESDPRVLTISPESGNVTALVLVNLHDNKVEAKSSDVSFNKYGNRYFLAGISVEGYSNSNGIQPSNYENLVAKGEVRGQGRMVRGEHKK